MQDLLKTMLEARDGGLEQRLVGRCDVVEQVDRHRM